MTGTLTVLSTSSTDVYAPSERMSSVTVAPAVNVLAVEKYGCSVRISAGSTYMISVDCEGALSTCETQPVENRILARGITIFRLLLEKSRRLRPEGVMFVG